VGCGGSTISRARLNTRSSRSGSGVPACTPACSNRPLRRPTARRLNTVGSTRSMPSTPAAVFYRRTPGTSEDWRPDAEQITSFAIGEFEWLSPCRLALHPQDRGAPPGSKALCRNACRPASTPSTSHVDVYPTPPSSPLTAATNSRSPRLRATRAFSSASRSAPNDIERVAALRPNFEFAVNELLPLPRIAACRLL